MMLYGILRATGFPFMGHSGNTIATIIIDGSTIDLIESTMDSNLELLSDFVFERNDNDAAWTLIKATPSMENTILNAMIAKGFSVQMLMFG